MGEETKFLLIYFIRNTSTQAKLGPLEIFPTRLFDIK